MSKKLVLSVAVVVALAVSACSSKGSSDATGSDSASGSEVTMLIAEGPEELGTFEQIVEAYNDSQSATHVTIIPVGEGEDLITRLSTDIAGGNAPDIFFSNYRYVGGFVAKDLLSPITDQLSSSTKISGDQFYPIALDAYNIGGEQYCMPFNASSLAVYYNKTLFEDAGLGEPADDWTWKDMVSDAKALTGLEPVEGGATGQSEAEQEAAREEAAREAGGEEAAAPEEGAAPVDPAPPVAMSPADELTSGIGIDPQFIRLMPEVWSAGGEVADAEENPTKLTMTSLPAQKGLTAFLNLFSKDHVAPSAALTESEGLESLFLNGHLGMFAESRKVVPTLRTISGFEWDVAPMPSLGQASTILHSDGYCITDGAKDPQGAWDFIEFAMGTQAQEIGAETGRAVPSVISVAESGAFLDPSADPSRSQVWLDQLAVAGKVPVIENWVEVEDITNGILEEGFFAGEDAAEVGDLMNRQTKPLLSAD